MRAIILAAAATFVLGASQAAAEDYPWCMASGSSPNAPQCSFTTYQECQAALAGVGGSCVRNPRVPATR